MHPIVEAVLTSEEKEIVKKITTYAKKNPLYFEIDNEVVTCKALNLDVRDFNYIHGLMHGITSTMKAIEDQKEEQGKGTVL